MFSLVLLFAFVLLRWRSLDGVLAGEQTALSLGINVDRLRIEIFLLRTGNIVDGGINRRDWICWLNGASSVSAFRRS